MTRRAKGFTLIELLVVIAIIGILAAMLFPVFARARESARKIQCLSNVKNIALAFQMYLTDYDRFPPSKNDAEGQAWFDNERPGGGGGDPGSTCWKAFSANPYLRFPVILDEYIKNRDVWRCPSAKYGPSGAPTTPNWILPGSINGPWWQYLKDHPNEWGRNNQYCDESGGGGPCCVSFPAGWGGTVTDSIVQRALASNGTGAPEFTIGYSGSVADTSTSAILDPSWLVVCADSQHWANFNGVDSVLYYPCRINWDCACGDWSDGEDCPIDPNLLQRWFSDAGYRRQFTRHMGGVNLGFADGHAKWWAMEAVESQTPNCDETTNWTINREGRQLRGFCPAGVN